MKKKRIKKSAAAPAVPIEKSLIWNIQLTLILAVAAIVYLPVLQGTYLRNWDDANQILDNPAVTNLGLGSLIHYFTSFIIYSYQPLASLSFALEFAVFGPQPFVPHATNYLLHLLNIVLVCGFLTELLPQNRKLAYLTTALFALAPIQTEAVAWISVRSTLLCAAFSLLALSQYLKYIRLQQRYRLRLTFALFTAALFCKAMAVPLPFVLLSLDVFTRREMNLKAWFEKVPFFLLALIFGIIGLFSRHVVDKSGSDYTIYFSLFQRVCLTSYSFVFYIVKTWLPLELHNFYAFPLKTAQDLLPVQYYFALLVLLFTISVGIFAWRNWNWRPSREVVFGVLFYSFNIFLTLNIFNFSPTIAADRYCYLPILGIGICFGGILQEYPRTRKLIDLSSPFMLILLATFAVITFTQSQYWKDEESLWAHTTQFSTGTYPLIQFGRLYADRKDFSRAIELYNRAVTLNVQDPDIYIERGEAIFNIGNFAYAEKDFSRVIGVENYDPIKKARAYNLRSKAREKLGNRIGALDDVEHAIKLWPDPLYLARASSLRGDTIDKKMVDAVGAKILEIARIALAQGDFAKVLTQCQTYQLMFPTSTEAQELLKQVPELFLPKAPSK